MGPPMSTPMLPAAAAGAGVGRTRAAQGWQQGGNGESSSLSELATDIPAASWSDMSSSSSSLSDADESEAPSYPSEYDSESAML